MSNQEPTELTREQMAQLLTERLPGIAPEHREALLTGTLLTLSDGQKYVVPTAPEDQHATHFIGGRIERIGDQWTQ